MVWCSEEGVIAAIVRSTKVPGGTKSRQQTITISQRNPRRICEAMNAKLRRIAIAPRSRVAGISMSVPAKTSVPHAISFRNRKNGCWGGQFRQRAAQYPHSGLAMPDCMPAPTR